MTDEGVEFFEMASRYSATGKGNFGIYLDGFDGNPHTSDRVGRDPIVIKRTTLTVCLFAQPVVLEPLAKDRQAQGRGLLARFLWSTPGSMVGLRQIHRRPVPAEMLAEYEDRLTVLAAKAEAVESDPVTLRLDTEARQLFLSWREDHEPRLRPVVGDLSGIVDWGNKLPGQVLRLAGNLHAIRTGTIHGAIGAETMADALKLADYFTDHALTVFGMMRADPATVDAQAVLAWLIERHADSFSLREVYTSKDWDNERTRAAVELLTDWNWVRKAERTKAPGRPPERWDVYPQLWSRTEHNPRMVDVMRRFAPEIPETAPGPAPVLTDSEIERWESAAADDMLFDDGPPFEDESIDQDLEFRLAAAANGSELAKGEQWDSKEF